MNEDEKEEQLRKEVYELRDAIDMCMPLLMAIALRTESLKFMAIPFAVIHKAALDYETFVELIEVMREFGKKRLIKGENKDLTEVINN